ncbi:AHH domain-containing protein [Acidovorax sp. NCPPB 4044]|uniref:AHH domain-containing protein n=1 Tax=Acidovorax sp. NCPPB 4044 TaxID=2940490 RepID=UPI002302EED4|nr:AHH domain-containing protein [Acidovorax sp. NCPPB 4044]MDA8520419.1 hypothetical protein [Acidovorax sp. NCPPB 4044]
MPANDVILQSHHVIEQSLFRDHDLLKKLVEHGLIDEHTSANRLYLPVDGTLADELETSPHRGRTRSSYTKGIREELNNIADTDDGVAALADDAAALRRVNARVAELQDTLKIALVNGDAFTTTPISLTKDQANAQNNKTFSDLDHYRATHADQLKALRSMGSVESEWAAITHSEHRIVRVIDATRATGSNLVAAPYEPAVREIAGREEFRLAIAHAEDAGRVTLSESNAVLVQQVLDDTPTTIGGAARGIRQVAGASSSPYTPLSQRGFATAELLAGDLSAGQALRSAGLLATAADAMASGQRSIRFLGQDNPLAAQSELAHFAGRNVGGWAGGTAAAYALGSSGAGPMVLIAADAYFMSAAGEKAAALLDNRAIYRQTDGGGTHWSFDGRAWTRGGMADTTGDGIDNPAATPIVASYAKARELNYQATNAAAALALKDAPAPIDPYRQPANAGDRPSLSPADWKRDPTNGQWHRLVKTEISGANDRGSYAQETALLHRAAELDAQAQATIARNIANSPGAIAARYELAYHRSGWAAEGLPMSPAVQQALPDPDALTASNGQRYYRNMEGQWTGQGAPPDANRVLELDNTRAMLQPALAEQAHAIAAIQQSPPSPQDVQREQTLYQYRIVGTELQPQWREAIELATQRTREAEGLAGDGAMQLQRGPGGQYGADSPIAHLQRGADGVERIAAVTTTEDIREALREVQAQQRPAVPLQHVASVQRPSEGSADTDTSDASPSNQHALDVQARGQAASAAQERQDQQQEDRQAREQHLAQARAHALQEQASHDDRTQATAALQTHAASELRQQESQQLQLQLQQRQALDAQQDEQRQQQVSHDARQQEALDRHAQQTQLREEEERQTEHSDQQTQERQQAHDAQHPEQAPLPYQAALQRQQEATQKVPSDQQPAPHHQDAQQRTHEQQRTPDRLAQRSAEPPVERMAASDNDVSQRRTQGQHAQEELARSAQRVTPHSAAISPASPEAARPVPDQQGYRYLSTPHMEQQPDESLHVRAVPASNPPAERLLAEHPGERPPEPTPDTPVPEVGGITAALPVAPHLASAPEPSLSPFTASRSAGMPENEGDATHPPPVAKSDGQAPSAPAVPDPNSWEEITRSMRELRIRLEQELETEDRIAQARQDRVERGEQPYTDLELREGYDPDGPSALRKPPSMPAEAAPQWQASTPSAGEQSDDHPVTARKTITGDPDVDDLLYAIDSKNDLAIEQALKRVANSAHSAALAEQGHAHLDAKAMQEAQDQATTRQALGMDVAAEIQTSRGPVMVMTLPQFAHGPAMQGGPQGDGGGGGGDGGGGGAGGGGGGGG